jgi:cytidine deaminase
MTTPTALSADEIDDLLRVAHAVALLAHSPYSKVQVGAALLGADGEVFTGCNVENASFGLTLCAERVAVGKAISAGVSDFRAVAIATSLEDPLMPCGACRQVLYEFAPELLVITQGTKGPRAEARLGQLLPRAFRPSDLGAGDA